MRSVPSPGDLTARATIRNEALRLFAERGPDAVSLRQIATAAGVSPALVVHHFGTKDGLRAAVDEQVSRVFDALLDEVLAGPGLPGQSESIATAIGRALPPDSPLPGYLRWLLLSGDPAGTRLFRSWHAATARLLTALAEQQLLAPHEDTPLRAALLLANDLAMILLREPIREVLGADPLAPDGLRRWSDEVTALYTTGLWQPAAAVDPTTNHEAAEEPR
ncbi:TetR/AcrR family transcriptional regulator [Amycolatopsis saalfeldensis]|uniref:DNA-binding transcriptional regulator, AcrR family n=1 Tax=Amycolatopsis saalfeldensis TaxID=394193 RepID=A0A1H8RQW0_9PSEU|nr:TetR/AcrR family transcriptional regulator [Amycolatopsis saalfeldensis]SEO68722.1 DNA-binding transcriptional regulator, AcrR family [Amycolatopsis saalfeldensis]